MVVLCVPLGNFGVSVTGKAQHQNALAMPRKAVLSTRGAGAQRLLITARITHSYRLLYQGRLLLWTRSCVVRQDSLQKKSASLRS